MQFAPEGPVHARKEASSLQPTHILFGLSNREDPGRDPTTVAMLLLLPPGKQRKNILRLKMEGLDFNQGSHTNKAQNP